MVVSPRPTHSPHIIHTILVHVRGAAAEQCQNQQIGRAEVIQC